MNLILPELLRRVPPEVAEAYRSGSISKRTEAERLNEARGSLTGYDCPICRNKGLVYSETEEKGLVSRECTCMELRRAQRRIRESGLQSSMEEYRFDNFRTTTPWQERFKRAAERFVREGGDAWFFAGGQPGVGKTHLCTAIAGAFLEQGKAVRYMLWKEASAKLKASVNEPDYERLLRPYREADVLYIDDLFKSGKADTGRRRPPTPGDVNLAFDLINARYINRLPTIFSTELTIEELIDADEAIGSRVYQRSKGYCFSFEADRGKNYRLAGSG